MNTFGQAVTFLTLHVVKWNIVIELFIYATLN